jgi:outer membrane lipoprotein carrier protein
LLEALDAVERHYNSARTLQLQFTQFYNSPGQGARKEIGTLYLLKPGRMRWEYSSPAGKLFVSDGKTAWFYSPAANRVERARVKEADDLRTPFAFLLGKLDFRRDFSKFYTTQEGSGTWVNAIPKSDKMPFSKVEFLLTPERRIQRLRITGQDQSVMDFAFADERKNMTLANRLFQFQAPAGVEIVEMREQ